MDLLYCRDQLSANAVAIQHLLAGVDARWARWKPAKEDWSILEVVNHLLDEEREDFRSRLQHLLSGSREPWPANAPGRWVTEGAYNQRDFDDSLASLLHERQRSLDWLPELSGLDWQLSYKNPPLEGITAGALLASWVGHDLLHLRQLIELKWAFYNKHFEPFSLRYAGDW
jgi:hypothetical protein